MPELPEVETIRRGIEKQIVAKPIERVIVRQSQLRWLVPKLLTKQLLQQKIQSVTRRGKYLLMHTAVGTVIMHFGMSGFLRLQSKQTQYDKHAHVVFVFENGLYLSFIDPRRFGAVLWTADDPLRHTLLNRLGPEPLASNFSADYLYQQTRKRKLAIKSLIMDSHVVVGVGNIYAQEALFQAEIDPRLPASHLSQQQCQSLVICIQDILNAAIKQGGTTLKNFQDCEGKPGYFVQSLQVYGREGQPCFQCKRPLQLVRINQRSTVYCANCQQ